MCNYCVIYRGGSGHHPSALAGRPVAETGIYEMFPSKVVKVKNLEGGKSKVRVCHVEDLGVICVGVGLVGMARKAMEKVGYDSAEILGWPYRPMMVDQVWSDSGHAVGGTSAVAFYFGSTS